MSWLQTVGADQSVVERRIPLSGRVVEVAGNTGAPGVGVVARAFDLLGAYDEAHRSLTLSELARRAGLPLATAHRLCAELVAVGALSRRGSGEYVIGRRLWMTGMLSPVQTGLRELAAPFLHDIHAATRATVHLAVRDGAEVLYLDRVGGGDSVPVVSRIGGRLPLHCTGVGKVLLAHAPAEVVSEALDRPVRYTPFTVVQPAVLAGQLERIRRDGFATTVDEMTVGASSIAVPIVRPTTGCAEVVAALGIVVVHLRRDRPRLLAALDIAARGVGRLLAGLR